MRQKARLLVRCAALLGVVSFIACNRNGSSQSPVAPMPGAGVPTLGSGAQITGTVTTGTGAMSLRPATAGGLTVTIMGTSMSASADGSGRFTLQNVPSGNLTLQFSGGGVDARITIDGVGDREQIHIAVTVNGNNANVEENERERPDNHAEVEGRIVSVSCAVDPATLVVGERTQTTVLIPSGTPIRHGDTSMACSQLQVGERVHVEGTKNGTSITAAEVKVQNNPGAEVPRNEVELKGTISSAITGACPSISFMVGSTNVSTNASTKFDDKSCAALRQGDRVEVKGTSQPSGSVLASKVENDADDGDENENDHEAEVKGTVAGAPSGHACPAFTFIVGSTTVATTASTKFKDTSCSGVVNGVSVEVEGTRTGPTAITASKVEKR